MVLPTKRLGRTLLPIFFASSLYFSFTSILQCSLYRLFYPSSRWCRLNKAAQAKGAVSDTTSTATTRLLNALRIIVNIFYVKQRFYSSFALASLSKRIALAQARFLSILSLQCCITGREDWLKNLLQLPRARDAMPAITVSCYARRCL